MHKANMISESSCNKTNSIYKESEQGIFEQVLHGDLDFSSDLWPAISESAEDLVRKMLVRDPRRRMTAHQVLCHPWVQVDGISLEITRFITIWHFIRNYSKYHNKVEREDHLFAAFSCFDKDGSGYITHEELQQACDEFGIKGVRLEEIINEIDQDTSTKIGKELDVLSRMPNYPT